MSVFAGGPEGPSQLLCLQVSLEQHQPDGLQLRLLKVSRSCDLGAESRRPRCGPLPWAASASDILKGEEGEKEKLGLGPEIQQ